MKKAICFIILLVLLSGIDTVCFAEIRPASGDALIGIAWREDTDSEFFTNVCRAIEAAGGKWVMLDQVQSYDLNYDEEGNLTDNVTQIGMLDEAGAKRVRTNTWYDSNVEDVVQNISLIIFTGGEDVSPTLYFSPEEWHGIEEETEYNAERDVSDYLTMSYCLDHDIPVLGICRGMQILSVVSGAEIIQDIPAYFESRSLDDNNEHRNEKSSPDVYTDYASHDVMVRKNTWLYQITGSKLLVGCPAWHHQAVKNVDNTRLTVSGYTVTAGVMMIEAVERTDHPFALGLQFHPEAALVKYLDNADNKEDFMDYETALSFFQWIVQENFLKSPN